MTQEIIECYDTLGLAPGVSRETVKVAYRDMAKVWHPDRFATDERLAGKAAEKIKEINAAYSRLEQYFNQREDDGEVPHVDVAPRQRPPSFEEPPIALPFTSLGRAVWGTLGIAFALAVIGGIVFMMTTAESSQATSQQYLQEAESDNRRVRAAMLAQKKAQEADRIAEEAKRAQSIAAAEARRLKALQRQSQASNSVSFNGTLKSASVPAEPPPLGEEEYQMGLKHANGQGVSEDQKLAFEWYRKGAEKNHTDAQEQLAYFYRSGKDVPQDLVEAYKWLSLAAGRGDKSAISTLPQFQTGMTTEQLEEARRRIRQFRSIQKPPAEENP